MKLGFTGTRRGMTPAQRAGCIIHLQRLAPKELHHGDALGADAEMHAIAVEHDVRVVVHPPLTSAQRAFCESDVIRPELPFMTRNRAIVDETDVLLAAPHGPEAKAPRSGTWRTIRYARRSGKPVVIVHPDGESTSQEHEA